MLILTIIIFITCIFIIILSRITVDLSLTTISVLPLSCSPCQWRHGQPHAQSRCGHTHAQGICGEQTAQCVCGPLLVNLPGYAP